MIIPLSPVDHIFTGIGSYPIEFIFYYNGKLDEIRLRKSLEKTMALFPVVSSKLIRIAAHSYGLETSRKGFDFKVTTLPDEFEGIESQSIFIDPVETMENEPLARIRLTCLKKGSVLGISISHAVADGFSYFYFLSAWARIFQNRQVIPPRLDRNILIPADTEGVTDTDGPALLNSCGLFLDERRRFRSGNDQIWESLDYKKEEIQAMINHAQSDSKMRLSVNDVITAALWKNFVLKWNGKFPEEKAFISCPVDFRRIMPGFPRVYFGDALCLATTSVEFENLKNTPVSILAEKVRNSISAINPSFIDNSMKTLEQVRKQNGLTVMERIHVTHPRSGLLVTNLSRLPVNEIVFNCGPPAFYNILTTAQRGAVILPAKDGIEVRVCHPSDH